MRILFVSDALSIHTRRWAEYFRDRGDEVHIASFRYANIQGVTLHLLPTYKLGKIGYLFSVINLRKIYKQVKPDIVHAQYITSYGFIAVLARIKPLIVTAWGTDVLISPQRSSIIRMITKYTIMNADVVTTVAEHMNNSIRDLSIDKYVEAIPFGVDINLFKIKSTNENASKKLSLICTRNFAPVYDVETLIKAIFILKEKNIHIKTTLIGDGPLRKELEDLVSQLNLLEQITFFGHIGFKELSENLADSDIFVSPAISDGNNVSLNEAMACGCFPIATNIPANAQWITHGYNGYLYPPGKPEVLSELIEQAINNKYLLGKSRQINRDIVEERANWVNCVKKVESIYSALITSQKRTEL